MSDVIYILNQLQNNLRYSQQEKYATEGVDSSTEHWVRAIVRQGTKAGRAWYQSGCFSFKRLRANTYQVRFLNNSQVTIDGKNACDSYIKIIESVETHCRNMAGQ